MLLLSCTDSKKLISYILFLLYVRSGKRKDSGRGSFPYKEGILKNKQEQDAAFSKTFSNDTSR